LSRTKTPIEESVVDRFAVWLGHHAKTLVRLGYISPIYHRTGSLSHSIPIISPHHAAIPPRVAVHAFIGQVQSSAMVLEYFLEADMLTIRLTDALSAESEEIAPGVVLDFDEQHQIVGVEIEDAGKRFDLSRLEVKALPLSSLLFTERTMVEVKR